MTLAASASTSMGGRCEACLGDGLIQVEMHFLPEMTMEAALRFFQNVPAIAGKLQTLRRGGCPM
jgi:excinuclease ABC subunit A